MLNGLRKSNTFHLFAQVGNFPRSHIIFKSMNENDPFSFIRIKEFYVLAWICKNAKPKANPKRVMTQQQIATLTISPIIF